MPIYDYDCAACGRRFELVHGVHADPPTTCPLCGKGPIRKAISAPAVHYKGSGWAKKERRATSTPGSSKSSAEGGATADSTGDATASTPSKTSESTTSSDGKASGSATPSTTASAASDTAKATD